MASITDTTEVSRSPSTGRSMALRAAIHSPQRKIDKMLNPQGRPASVSEYFGSNTFGLAQMREKLPRDLIGITETNSHVQWRFHVRNFAGTSQIAANTLLDGHCFFRQELARHLVKMPPPCRDVERRFTGLIFHREQFDAQKMARNFHELPIISGPVQ